MKSALAIVFVVATANGVKAQDAPAAARLVEPKPVVAVEGGSSPEQLQNERLRILTQERTTVVASLAAATRAAGSATTPEERTEATAKVQRISGDLRALEREILAVAKAPPAPLRNTSPVHVARNESAVQTAATPSPMSKPASPAFEGWDVFKNFGKQGATP